MRSAADTSLVGLGDGISGDAQAHDLHGNSPCTITAVEVGKDNIYGEFTGRWSPAEGFADTDKNGFSIGRDRSVS